MVVYIDLMFAANLAIDFALLWLTAWMVKRKPKIWRLLLAALAGALYVVMMFVPQLSFLYTFLVKIGLSLVMLWIAFGFHSLQMFARAFGAFYVINFAAAGCILGVHYLLQSTGELWEGMLFTASGGLAYRLTIGFGFVLLILPLGFILFRFVHASRISRQKLDSYIGEVAVEIGDATIVCPGLLDTGNRLSDPLTRAPVMVMEAALWEDRLPASWRGRLGKEGADRLLLDEDGQTFPWQDRLRIVPYRGVNRSSSFMLALKPDRVTVRLGGEDTVSEKVLIGLDGGTLSPDGAYRAIIHPELAGGPNTDKTAPS